MTSEHFSAAELACKHCGQEGAKPELFVTLEKLRAMIGRPIIINSGYRCPKHPVEAAKPKPGQHSKGIAADIRVKGMNARVLYEYARLLPEIKGFGVSDEGKYVHIDLRKVPAKWCYDGAGKPVPWSDRPVLA